MMTARQVAIVVAIAGTKVAIVGGDSLSEVAIVVAIAGARVAIVVAISLSTDPVIIATLRQKGWRQHDGGDM